MDKFIFVTGGVMSGLGKGITSASTGRLLKNASLDVTAVKIDPYLNVDAGTMNPFEHGEVFVLKDGTEVDLDLGNYERFLDIDLSGNHNVTTGKVFQTVIERERAGDYLGQTVQYIPQITDEIKRRLNESAEGHDVCIVELGGTIGDIESMAFLEAVRQMHSSRDEEDIMLIHVSLVPLTHNGEQKTKPTQHSVQNLREIGLQPDVIVGRCEEYLEPSTREKISLFCDVPEEAVISAPDVDDIYHVPLTLEEQGLDDLIVDLMDLTRSGRDTGWRDIVTREPEKECQIALAGKYNFEDAYLSIYEALKHVGYDLETDVEVLWVDCDKWEPLHRERLGEADGVIVPGGFGERGTDGKLETIQFAREEGIPFLGICFGFQLAVVEFARNVLGLEGAHSAELHGDTPDPVIALLPDQYDIDDMGGTMRLGSYVTSVEEGTLAHRLYGEPRIQERHRHRFEVNPNYIDRLEEAGLRFSGRDHNRMEILELPDHPFFLGTQFHPEFTSRPTRPSPPFQGFVKAALQHAGQPSLAQ